MKSRVILYIYILVCTSLLSCKENSDLKESEKLDSITDFDPDLEKKLKYESDKDLKAIGIDSTITNKFLTKIANLQSELSSKLVKADSIKANALYEEYSKKLIENLTDFNFGSSDLLDNYANQDPKEIPLHWTKKIENLKKSNIELVYEGEGYHSFQFRHDYFYKTFKGKVSKDLNEFLYNMSEDDKVIFQSDAGILVPWKEIRVRILRWERFVKKYPESRYSNLSKELLGFYIKSYLLGMENTRTFESNTKEIYPEVIQDFNIFLKENKNTFSAEFLQDFLDFYTFAAKEYPTSKFSEALNTYVDGLLQETLNRHSH